MSATHRTTTPDPPAAADAGVPTEVTAAMQLLRHAGAINGCALCRGSQLLVNWLPYTARRAQHVLGALHELVILLRKHDRQPKLFRFELEKGGLVAVLRGDLRLILLHADPREALMIGAAGSAFMLDLDHLWRRPSDWSDQIDSHSIDPPSGEPLFSKPPLAPAPSLPTTVAPPTPKPVPIAPEPSSGQLGRIIHPDRTHIWFRGAPQHRSDADS